jgi:hypothetical protein
MSGKFFFEEYIGSHSGYRRYPVEESTSYGDWEPKKTFGPSEEDTPVFVQAPYASGSDYSGSLVERSNFDALLEIAGDDLGRTVFTAYGGYDTFALFVWLGNENEALWEAMAGLDRYPLLDEQRHSELEMEAQEENWKSWAESDFRRAVEKEFSEEWNPEDAFALDEWLDDLGDDIRVLFEHAREAANEYWVNESGYGMYIDIEKIVEAMTPEYLRHFDLVRRYPEKHGELWQYGTFSPYLMTWERRREIERKFKEMTTTAQ